MSALQRTQSCPMDRRPMQAQNVVSNRFAASLIDALEVFCPQRDAGCSWTGRRDRLVTHESKCLALKFEALQTKMTQMEQKDGAMQAHIQALEDTTGKQHRALQQFEALKRKMTHMEENERAVQAKIQALEDTVEQQKRRIQLLESMPYSQAASPMQGQMTAGYGASSSSAMGSKAPTTPTPPWLRAEVIAPLSPHRRFQIAGDHDAACLKLGTFFPHPISAKASAELAWQDLKNASLDDGYDDGFENVFKTHVQDQMQHHSMWPVYMYTSMSANIRFGEMVHPTAFSDFNLSHDINYVLGNCNFACLENYLAALLAALRNNRRRMRCDKVWRGMQICKEAFDDLKSFRSAKPLHSPD